MAKKYADLSEVVTWLAMTNKNVILNNNGTLQKTYSFYGSDCSAMTDDDFSMYFERVNNALKRIPHGYMLFFESQKEYDTDYIELSDENKLQREFDEIRKENLTNTQNFKIRYYLTIVYKEPNELLKRVGTVIDKDNKTVIKEFKGLLRETFSLFNPKLVESELDNIDQNYIDSLIDLEANFLENCNDIILLLQKAMPVVKALNREETLTYLHSTISDQRYPIKTKNSFFITQNLSDAPLLTGRSPKLGEHYIGVIGIKDLPSTTYPTIFNRLNSLQSEYRFCTRWIGLSKDQSKKELLQIQKNHYQRAKSMFTMMYEAIQNKESSNVDVSAIRDGDEVTNAILELESDAVSFGYLTINIVLLHKNYDFLQEELQEIKSSINELGFVANIEKDNATSAWLSTIPSVYTFNLRKFLVHSMTMASCSPLSSMYEGQKKNNHFTSLNTFDAALLKTTTPEGLPFYLNLHVNDVGHTFIAGATGTGKSVFLNTLVCNYLKYKDAKVFIFDKSASSRVLTKAMGGNFYNLLVDTKSIAFQPLSQIDKDTDLIWVHEWLLRYATAQNFPITPENKKQLLDALRVLKDRPVHLRTMTSLKQTIQNEDWRLLLNDLTGIDGKGGAYGQLFDSDIDKFGQGNWQVFEMEKLMENEAIVAPTLDYLFHRIEQQLTGSPTIIVLDECWLFLRNKSFSNKIVEYLKDLRKKNAIVVMATQNLSDISEEIKPVVINNMPTKIFMPNTSSSEVNASMYYEFGLNSTEQAIIRHMIPKQEYYFKSPDYSRIFNLYLSKQEIAFLAATAKSDQLKVAELEHLTPAEFIQAWKEYKGV